MRFPLALLAAACLAVPPAAIAQADAPTIKVDTRLVIVPVVVRDKKGALVRTLKREDFAVTENGKAQAIRYFDTANETPLTVGLLVDVSGSGRDVLDEERTASSAFLDTLLRPERDKAFVVQFGRQADLLADVTGSLPRLEAGLKKLDGDSGRPQFGGGSQGGSQNGSQGGSRGGPSGNGDPQDSGGPDGQNDRQSGDPDAGRGGGPGGGGRGRRGGRGGFGGGGTVLYDAVFLSSDEVIRKETNRKALVLLTDGEDRGSKESIAAAIEAAQRANATVYAIYFNGEEHGGGGGGFPGGGGGRHGGGFPGGGGWPGGSGGGRGGRGGGGEERVDGKKILARMCDETGGRLFEVSKKQNFDAIYKQISEELRSEYRLGFTPTDASEGYHRIVVDLPKDTKSFIQARDGYYVGGSTR